MGRYAASASNEYASLFATHFNNCFLITSFDQTLIQTYQRLIQKERVDFNGESSGQICKTAWKTTQR